MISPPSSPPGPPAAPGLRHRVLVALSLLLLMLYPHSGALGLASAPLLLLCLWAFVAIGTTLHAPSPPQTFDGDRERRLLRGLALLLALLQLVRAPGDALQAGTSWLPHSLLALLLAGIASVATQPRQPRLNSRALAVLAVLATAVVFGYLLRHAPSPRIDVFQIQQRGAELLAAGANPYSALYPNPYDPVETTAFFGHYSASLDHYPYPPLSLLLTTLLHRLTHDVRWLFLLLHLLIACVLYRLGRRWQQRRAERFDLGLVLLCIHLLHPRGFLVIEQAWTEPLLAAAIALWADFRARHSQAPQPPSPAGVSRCLVADSLLLGVALACKQYGLLLLAPYLSRSLFAWLSPTWLHARRRLSLGISLLPLAIGYLLFAAWQPADFVEDVVLFQLKQPFRSEALSLPALLYALSDIKLPGAIAAVGLLLPPLWLGRGRPPRLPAGLGGQLLLFSLMLFGFFVTAKQAFCNYYYLVGVLLLLTLTQLDEEPAGDERS